MARDGEYAIFLNGSYGVGKSAVLDAVGDRFAATGRAFSLMDVDWFHRSWPVAEGDTENTVLEARNIAAAWANYRAAGPRQLVLSGVLTSSADLDRYAEAVDLPVRSIRLVARPTTIEARLRSRYDQRRQHHLEWHLDRFERIAERQAAADLDELVVDTDTIAPADVADIVLRHFELTAGDV
ncbi:hypothetical protein [Curtobacterium sp. NPDC089689]|uniref:hypothetical protein n=1 Tax=Curtobacterium sp. NPDC089689 TaxID=3363968 RepID=UPI003808AF8D